MRKKPGDRAFKWNDNQSTGCKQDGSSFKRFNLDGSFRPLIP